MLFNEYILKKNNIKSNNVNQVFVITVGNEGFKKLNTDQQRQTVRPETNIYTNIR